MAGWEFALRRVPGKTLVAGDALITPVAQALIVRTPVGGFVWNRPLAVRIERRGRVEQRRLLDVTRLAQAALLASGIAAGVLLARRPHSRGERR